MEHKGSSTKNIEEAQESCYEGWMNLQSQRVQELKEALAQRRAHGDGDGDGEANNKLRELGEKIIGDFKDYARKRADLSNRCSSNYYAPSWNTPLENALIWMGGCRPSSFFRLVYALCGSQTEIRVTQFLRNIDGYDFLGGSLSDLTAEQLAKINVLHVKVIEEEEKKTKKVSSLQEDAADIPISTVAYSEEHIGEPNKEVDEALDKQEEAMARLLAEADSLRVDTLTKIVEILSPIQAADFLLASKKLHLSMHQWGTVRDRRRRECVIDTGNDAVGGKG